VLPTWVQVPLIGSAPSITGIAPASAVNVMGCSAVPDVAGVTVSWYVPLSSRQVSPGCTTWAQWPMVLNACGTL
jgi:hypothetical protein